MCLYCIATWYAAMNYTCLSTCSLWIHRHSHKARQLHPQLSQPPPTYDPLCLMKQQLTFIEYLLCTQNYSALHMYHPHLMLTLNIQGKSTIPFFIDKQMKGAHRIKGFARDRITSKPRPKILKQHQRCCLPIWFFLGRILRLRSSVERTQWANIVHGSKVKPGNENHRSSLF